MSRVYFTVTDVALVQCSRSKSSMHRHLRIAVYALSCYINEDE